MKLRPANVYASVVDCLRAYNRMQKNVTNQFISKKKIKNVYALH